MLSGKFDSLSVIDSNSQEILINPAYLHSSLNRNIRSAVMTFTAAESPSDLSSFRGLTVNGAEVVFKKDDDGGFSSDSSFSAKAGDNGASDIWFLMRCPDPVEAVIEWKVVYRLSDGKAVTYTGRTCMSRNVISSTASWFDRNAAALTDTNSSFLLMRTNPMLTGNIKLVVCPDDTMFLDAFKVSGSDTLAKDEYHHRRVSANSYLNTDIRNVFATAPSDALYGVDPKNLKAHKAVTSYSEQYDTEYSYGCKTNNDRKYPWTFRLLAPLKIGQNMPDWFVVFRIQGPEPSERYKGMTDTDIFNEFLRNAVPVRAWSMKAGSPLGGYLRRFRDACGQYPGSVRLQFRKQEDGQESGGINSWIGVSVDSGLYVKKDEISYFADKMLEESSQERLNQFVTDGFRRNRLVSPDIVNLEFMFDDDVTGPFTVSRYFGLYLKQNDIVNWDFVEESAGRSGMAVRRYDADRSESEDSVVSDPKSVIWSEKYRTRLMFAVSGNNARRVCSWSDISDFLGDCVSGQPGDGLFRLPALEISPAEDEGSSSARKLIKDHRMIRPKDTDKSFITMQFKDSIRYGEHFRICVPSVPGLASGAVFEILASNNPDLLETGDFVSPYISLVFSGSQVSKGVIYRSSVPNPVRQEEYFRMTDGQSIEDEYVLAYAVKYRNRFNATNQLYHTTSLLADNLVSNDQYPYIFRILFYTQDLMDPEKPAPLSEQIERLSRAVRCLREDFHVDIWTPDHSEDTIAVVSGYNDTYMQHITADVFDGTGAAIENTDGIWHEGVDSAFRPDPGVRYFGTGITEPPCLPLCNDTTRYNADSVLFAPIGFELLGWRRTSIVRFMDLKEWMYQVTLDDPASLPANTVAALDGGTYSRLLDWNVDSRTIDTFWKDDSGNAHPGRWETGADGLPFLSTRYECRIGEHSGTVHAVRSPFDTEKWLLSLPSASADGLYVDLYSPKRSSVSIMGIMPVKDIDTRIGVRRERTVRSRPVTEIPGGSRIYIDNNLADYTLMSNVCYILSEGRLSGIPVQTGGRFIIINGVLYFRKDAAISTYRIQSDYMIADENTVITSLQGGRETSYRITVPAMEEEFSFRDADPANDLTYPLLTPVICSWDAVGLYYDNSRTLNIDDILTNAWKDPSAGYMCFRHPYTSDDPDRYVSRSFDMYIGRKGGDDTTFRDYLLKSDVTDSVNFFLTEKVKPEYTVGWYNKFVNTLEFTVSGIRFSLGFSTAGLARELQLSNYNKYEMFVLNDYTGGKNEMIINTIENTIFIINHNFNFGLIDQKSNIITVRNRALTPIAGDLYNWTRVGYAVQPGMTDILISPEGDAIAEIPVTGNEGTLTGTGLLQESRYAGVSGYDDDQGRIFGLTGVIKPVDGFIQVQADIRAVYGSGGDTEPGIIRPERRREESADTWIINPSAKEIGAGWDALMDAYIKSMDPENFTVYIKHLEGGGVATSKFETSADWSPMTIRTWRPSAVKYANDFFNPSYTDVMTFDLNETDELIRATGVNFTLANTSFRSVAPLRGYYGRKVVPNDTVDMSGTVNYFKKDEHSLVRSNWDSGYYRLYTGSGDEWKPVDGWRLGIEDKAFFSSACINIKTPRTGGIIISSWGSAEAGISKSAHDGMSTLTLNLTRALQTRLMSDDDVYKNWKLYGYNSDAVNNFVKRVLSRYFISSEKNILHVYRHRTLKETGFIGDPSKADLNEFEEVKNLSVTYAEVNEELTVSVELPEGRTWYVEYEIPGSGE